MVISSLVYPVAVIAINGYYDYGSGVVHHLSGVCALKCAVFFGPRIKRFDSDGTVNDIRAFVSLGAFILMFGSFNSATNGAVARCREQVN